MKRLQKLLCGLLTVAMLGSTMLMPAFADAGQIGDGNTAIDTLTVTSTMYVGEGIAPEGTWTYTLTPADPAETETEVQKGFALADGTATVTYTSLDAATDGVITKTANISLAAAADVTLTAGVYRYELRETAPAKGASSIKLSDGSKETLVVDLYVTNLDGGSKAVSIVTVSDGETKMDPVFAHEYPLTNIVVNEHVDGALANEDKFDVTVIIPEGGTVVDLTKDATYTVEITYANGEQETTTFSVNDEGTGNTITMGNGDSFTIKDVPVGLNYYVVQTPTEGVTGYDTTYTVTNDNVATPAVQDGGTTEMEVTTKTINQVDLYNVKDVQINTGVSMDTAPYVMMFAGMAALAVLAVAKKKIAR